MRKVALWLSLVLIFVIPWENMIMIEGVGTAGRTTGLVVGALWVATVVVTGRFRKPHPFHIAFCLFVLWNAASALWSLDLEDSITSLTTYVQLTILVFVLWDLYTSPAALRAGLQAYILGAYVTIGSTVVNYLAVGEFTSDRYSATGFNPNAVGVILALGIPLAWHLAISERGSRTSPVLKLVNYAYIPAAILATLLTASRGSLIATVPALLFVLGTITRLSLLRRALILVALVAALFALQSLIPQSSLQRLSTTGTSLLEGDLGGREYIWQRALVRFAEHPLFGTGSGTFQTAIGASSHSTFLSILIETGIIGFALFSVILAITVYHATQQPKRSSFVWLTILLIWAIGNSTHGWTHRKPTWLFLSLVIVSADLAAHRRRVLPSSDFSVKSRVFGKEGVDEAYGVIHDA